MELIVLKNNFKKGFDAICRVGGDSVVALPILNNFLIETVDNKIKLSATNLELAISSFVPAKVVEGGGLTIPLGIINSIINNIQSEKITLKTQNDNLIVKTDNYQAKIQGIKNEEFPIIPDIENKKNILEIPAVVLRQALNSVVGSVQFSNIRQELNGVLFDFQINFLKIAATDSFRLSEKTIINTQIKTEIDKKFKAIVPLKTINEAIRIFKQEDDEKIKVFFDQSQVLFENNNTKIISRLIGGEFPDYQSIVPRSNEAEVVLSKERLNEALKLTSSFAGRSNEIKIIFQENAKNIEARSGDFGLGDNHYLIPAKIKGGPMEIVFNWKFLMDGVKAIESENIFLGLNSNNKPAVLKSPNDPSYFYVLMPVKAA